MTAGSNASLLQRVSVRLEILQESERRFARELAPHFNLLDPFRVDELAFSRCLAQLLDPSGSHGQGDLFLKPFLEKLGITFDFRTLQNVKVGLEKLTDEGRRIDIVIDSSQAIVGIENKPWAGYQARQLQDYADHLAKIAKGRSWTLVCLDNAEPSESSICRQNRKEYEAKGQFAHLTYDDITNWLANAAPFCQALKVRVFVEELTAHINKEVNGALDMTEEREVESIVSESESNLESALVIAKSLPKIKRRMLKRLLEQLQDNLGKVGLVLDKTEAGFLRESAEYGFNIYSYGTQVFTLRFTFEHPGLDSFYWGITTFKGEIQPGDEPAAKEIFNILERKFQTGSENKWWVWWTYAGVGPFSAEYTDWSSSARPWVSINDGTLAEQIAELAREVYNELSNKGNLLLGEVVDSN